MKRFVLFVCLVAAISCSKSDEEIPEPIYYFQGIEYSLSDEDGMTSVSLDTTEIVDFTNIYDVMVGYIFDEYYENHYTERFEITKHEGVHIEEGSYIPVPYLMSGYDFDKNRHTTRPYSTTPIVYNTITSNDQSKIQLPGKTSLRCRSISRTNTFRLSFVASFYSPHTESTKEVIGKWIKEEYRHLATECYIKSIE